MNSTVARAANTSTILGTSLHHLDIDGRQCSSVPVPTDSDLQTYFDALLKEIANKPQSRSYRLASDRTEFATSLANFFSEQLLVPAAADALAARLLRIETSTDDRYGHLAAPGATHVKRGSFLQFLFDNGGTIGYLAVKVDHQSILDEIDFKRRIGLGESQKLYKACRVNLDANGAAEHAVVFDTNAKPSVYWWQDVWELQPVRSDTVNTEQAVKHVIHVLTRLKKRSPVDYTILRNATIAAFKQSGPMDFDAFVTTTFAGYQPQETSIHPKLQEIVTDLRALPTKKQFDSHFNLDPAAVPYKQHKVELNTGISLSYEEGIANLSDRIWASKTIDGKDVVVIDAPEASSKFVFKPWE